MNLEEINLEEINEVYSRLTSVKDKYEKDINKYKDDVESAKKDKDKAENALKSAKTNKEKKQFQKDLNDALTTISNLEAEIKLKEGKIKEYDGEINGMLNDLKSVPEIREQCNRAMEIRAERKIDRLKKQKKEQEEKKSSLTQLKNIIQKYPQAQIFVNNIENKSLEISKKELEIKKLDEEIAKLDPKDADYATNKAKLETDKAKLNGECNTLKTERQSNRDSLKKLINNTKLNPYIDNLTTRNALDKEINNANRLVERSENKIKDYKYAKDSLYYDELQYQPIIPENTPTRWENFKENFKSIFSKKQPGDPSRLAKIGNTIKGLFAKSPALPAPTAPSTSSTPTTSFKDNIKVDKDIMKYKVVQDLYNKDLKDRVEDGKEAREESGPEL